MWKQSVAREARLISRLAISSPAICPSTHLRFVARPLSVARTYSSRPTILRTAALLRSRNYATEATAEAVDEVEAATPGGPGRPKRFTELLNMGVHPNLVRQITDGMKYETMSDVQSLTIVPALSGKDMYASVYALSI
jgi:ATP-dependent RNA helicase MSS116, mitochondrial